MMIREEDLTYSQLTPNIQNSQEIVSRLSSISELGKIDVLMYLVLLDSGPLIARMLAKKMNLGRVRTYQCLEKLRNHGLVTTTLSNPSFCEAVKPNDAFTTILQKKNDEVMAVKKTVKQISQLFKKTKFCNFIPPVTVNAMLEATRLYPGNTGLIASSLFKFKSHVSIACNLQSLVC